NDGGGDSWASTVGDRVGSWSERERKQRGAARAIPEAAGSARQTDSQRWRCGSGVRESAGDGGIVLRTPVHRARDDGTDELHGARAGRWRPGLGAVARPRMGAAGG